MLPVPCTILSIRDAIVRHCTARRQATSIPRLTLFHVREPTPPVRSMYDPRLCVVVQGRKQVLLGDRTYDIGARESLIATADLPVTARVTKASADTPHLAITLDLDRARMAELLLAMPDPPSPAGPSSGLAVVRHTDDLLEAVARLMGLLDRPADIPVMAPLIEREIHYRLLQGELGTLLAQFATAGTHLSQIGQVTDWIKSHYAEPMSIEDLAKLARMSVTSFHRHFKVVTAMSPLQYRTRIRLEEARRRLLVEGRDAGAIGFEVGYDSSSQFSREYRKMFGVPPATDAARLRRVHS
ncbi:AraC family transcriptional regulator [Pendulispora brunnea]|uniref:AraC family transcriptional regulator n=1 Tax=Pendulispora brunnea TaxID=2905690 RepID=A0ABZ2K9Q9_9BACT